MNQDRFAVRTLRQLGTWEVLLMVADGMGGHQAGEVASSLAVADVIERCDGETAAEDRDLEGTLRAAIEDANETIRQAAAADSSLLGMGTTVTAAIVRKDQLFVGHVGDSRLYLLRRGTIHQLTRDHSWVAQEVREGRLSHEEAARHPERHVLTQAVGGTQRVTPDTAAYALENGDALLLCTDGLSTMVEPEELIEVIRKFRQPEVAAEQLVALANVRGAPDNVTAVVARVVDHDHEGRRTCELPAHSARRSRLVRVVALGIVAVLLTVGGFVLYWLGQ